MKLRLGFVSNSSSASFVIALDAYENVLELVTSTVVSIIKDPENYGISLIDDDIEQFFKPLLKALKRLQTTGINPDTGICIPTVSNYETIIVKKPDGYYLDSDQGGFGTRGFIDIGDDESELGFDLGKNYFFYDLERDVIVKKSEKRCELNHESQDKFYLVTGELVCPICDREKILPHRILKENQYKCQEDAALEQADEGDGDDEAPMQDLTVGNLPELITKTRLEKKYQLDLTGLNLKTLPEEICQLTFLQKLLLRENELKSVPEAIGNLTQLQILNLFHNQLESLPDTLGTLTSLRELSLSCNKFSLIPPILGEFPSLCHLYLAQNKIQEFPLALARLISLELLDLSSNQLTSLPEWIGDLPKLHTLLLAGNQFPTLPDAVCNLNNLQTLTLSHNKLTQLPESLERLVSLRCLRINRNNLKRLPENVGKLYFLQDLNISHNKVTELPKEVGKLTNLQWINISQNLITHLPETILDLPHLTRLECWNNQLDKPSKDILKQLQKKGVQIRD